MKSLRVILAILFTTYQLHAQLSLNGTVSTSSGTPLAGASVSLQGIPLQLTTESKGTFTFSRLKPGDYRLQCRYLGYEDIIINLNIKHDTTININLINAELLTGEIIVSATRAGKNSGMAFSEVNKENIQKINLGQDVPYLLEDQPSVVVTSDAGTGIGYTGIRIRGSDPSRINVTINGIPVNDAESQQMYWVDLPDFASSTENIQIQRGAGTSTNGAGAFGGSINLLSNQLSKEAFAQSSNSFGSFNTIKNNISLGSGLLNNHWSFEGRLSRIKSDGYIDRGASDLKSYFFSTGYYSKSTIVRFITFSGKEITYQSWYGTPESRYRNDVPGMMNYIANNGLDEQDAANFLNSGRTYNYYIYDNQVDDYQQDNYQLLISQNLSKTWFANIAFHYTKGKGFYEEYKKDQSLLDYNIIPQDSLHENSDLIRRKWLDNDFFGTTFNMQGTAFNKLKIMFGGAWNRYEGGHYGEVIWAQNAGNSVIRQRYYDDDANKNDFNVYLKGETEILKNLNLFADFQGRNVTYQFLGLDDNGNAAPQNANLNFFNPKGGITWTPSTHHEFYGSVSVANKEPNRDDYVESTNHSRPVSEELTDYELGYHFTDSRLSISANGYFMDYKNQLVLTGKVNDVGNYTRENIGKSYRTGVELQVFYSLMKNLKLEGSITLSNNKIKKYIEYLDEYDDDYNIIGQFADTLGNVNIAFSPNIISSASLSWMPIKNLELKFNGRYIGKQYLKNTNDNSRILNDYTLFNLHIGYSLKKVIGKEIEFALHLNNLLNKVYASNGYTYDAIYSGAKSSDDYFYPQAGFNMLGQITFKF